MAYVLTDGSTNVVIYPYSLGNLRVANPNVSFPPSPTDAQFAEWNVFPVVQTTPPTVHLINENLVELNPLYNGESDVWTQRWSVVEASVEEIAERTAAYEVSSNAEAVRLLADSETYWIQAFENGVGLTTQFLDYRQSLYNVSSLTGYPAYTEWPSLPAEIFDSSVTTPIPYSTSSPWKVIADTSVTNTAYSILPEYPTVADLLASATEGMIVARDGNEYISHTTAAVAVVGFPAIFPLTKGGSTIAQFEFTSATDTTMSITLSACDQVIVLMR